MPLRDGCTDEDIQANIQTLIAEGKPPDQAAAIAHERCGKSVPVVKGTKRIQSGSLIKAISQDTFEGHLIRYGARDDSDIHHEWFSTKTMLMRTSGYAIKGRPINYQHGLDTEFGSFPIGVFNFVEEDDIGLFVRGQLHLRDSYIDMLKELGRLKSLHWKDSDLHQRADIAVKSVTKLIHDVPMQFSMGADLAAYVVNEKTGHIDQCGIVHGALTPTPADDKNPLIQFKSAWRRVITPDTGNVTYSIPSSETVTIEYPVDTQETGTKGHAQSGLTITVSKNQPIEVNDMSTRLKACSPEEAERLRVSLNEWLEAYIAEAGMDANEGQMAEMTDEMEENLNKQDDASTEGVVEEAAAAVADEVTEVVEEEGSITQAVVEQIVEDNLEEILPEVVKAFMTNQAKSSNRRAAGVKKAMNKYKDTVPAESHKSKIGGFSRQSNVRVSEPRKYVALTGEEMALGLKIASAALYPYGVPAGANLGDIVKTGLLSEEYVQSMAHKIADDLKTDGLKSMGVFDRAMIQDRHALKTAMPFKADELDATAITNQGAEWAFIWYDTRLWERARHETKLFNLMVAAGMRTADVQSKTMNVKLETGSPTVYTAPESRSLDSTGLPEVVVQTTPFTTDEVEKTVKKHMLASAFSEELNEDSIIVIQQFLNQDAVMALAESLESVFYNGDTTNSSSNINTDTAPETGIQTPDYIAWDGIRHNFLVENTDFGNAKGSALQITDYENTINLLDTVIRPRKNNLLFIVDYATTSATRKLPELLTDDVKTSGGAGTAFAGRIEQLFEVLFYTSGFAGLSQADGFISDTGSNNTKGGITCVYAPYWQYGRRREMTIEFERFAQRDSTVVVASVRHILVARSSSAAAGTFNLTV